MKQTAVEWLVTELFALKEPNSIEIQIIDQAKEMENQQKGYSEEEVLEILQKALTHQDDGETGSLVTAQGELRPPNFYSWFERFKKK